MVQELVERYRQETEEAEAYEEAYEKELENLWSFCVTLFKHPEVVRTPGRSVVHKTLEANLIAGGEEFSVRLQSGCRYGARDIMAVVIKDSQGRIAPVFYLNMFLKTLSRERNFSQSLEVCGISLGNLREEDIWLLNEYNSPRCGLRKPFLEDITRYRRVLEEMRRVLE